MISKKSNTRSIKINNTYLKWKEQYDIKGAVTIIPALTSCKKDKYQYLKGEEILPLQ